MIRIANGTVHHVRPYVDGKLLQGVVLAPRDSVELDVNDGTTVEFARILDNARVATIVAAAVSNGRAHWLKQNIAPPASDAGLAKPFPGVDRAPKVLNARGSLPAWQDYVTVAIRKVPAPNDNLVFNTRECPIRRSVVISGAHLEWRPTRDPAIKAFEGETVLDVVELTLVADHIIIAAPLRFPGTNVTIKCRTLEFQNDGSHSGSIDTTPLDYPVGVPAYSPTRWSNPEDADDHTSYPGVAVAGGSIERAASGQAGADGQDAGTITLCAKEILYPLNSGPLLRGHGGRGEEGEPGGLAPRAKDDKVPDLRRRSDLSAVVATFAKSNSVSSWQWPAQMYGLLSENADTPTSIAYARVLFIDDVILEEDFNEFVLGQLYAKYTNAFDESNLSGFWGHEGYSADAPRPPSFPSGPSAYPGGEPGRSGKGADVHLNLKAYDHLAGLTDAPPGPAAAATAAVEGVLGRAGVDLIAVDLIAIKAGGWHDGSDWKPESRSTPLKSGKGLGAPALAAPPAASKGQVFDGSIMAQVIVGAVQRIAGPVGKAGSWLDSAALDAVLAQARDTFRAGFRVEAWNLLEPYFAEQLAGGEIPAPQGIVIESLRHRLNANLDYRGRPVGYVPHLDAMSSFTNNKSIRAISQQLIGYAEDTIAAFDQLEAQLDTLDAARTGFATKIEESEARVRAGMEALKSAAIDLDEVIGQVQAKSARIEAVTNEATIAAKGQVTAQAVFSGCCHLIGGVLQAIPVGQPYLGLAGSAVGTVGDFKIELPPGQDRAGFFADQTTKLAKGLGGDISTFISKSQDQILLSSTADPSIYAGQADSLKLSALIAKAKAGLTTDEQAVADANAARSRSLEEVTTSTATLAEDRIKAKTDLATAMAKQAVLQAAAETAFDINYKARIGHGGDPDQTKTAYAIALKAVSDAKSIAEAAKQKLLDVDGRVSSTKTSIQAAESNRDAIDAKVKQAKLDQDNRKQTVTEVCGRLRSAGEGLTGIGAGIGELIHAGNVGYDDPQVLEIVKDALAASKDFAALQREFGDLAKRQATAIETLQRAQSAIKVAHSDIASGLDQITSLTLKVTDISSLADVRTRQNLVDLRERGREYARESIDTLVAALRYEFVMDIRPDALDDAIGVKIAGLTAAGSGSAPTTAMKSDAIDTAYWVALCQLAIDAEKASAQRGTPKSMPAAHSVFTSDLLQRISAFGQVIAHGVYDLRIVPSFSWRAARVSSIVVKAIDTQPRLAPGDYLQIVVEHGGNQLILEQEEESADDPGKRPTSQYFYFQNGTDTPRQWSARAEIAQDGLSYNITLATEDTADVETLLAQMLADNSKLPSSTIKLAPYNPGVYSYFRIAINRPPLPDGTYPALPTVSRLEFEIHYDASFDESVSGIQDGSPKD